MNNFIIKLKVSLCLLVLSCVFSFFLLNFLGRKLNPILVRYVDVEANRFASNIVNSTVNEIIYNNDEELFIIKQNKNLEVEMLDYDTRKVNKLLLVIINDIQGKLTNLEDGKIEEFNISNNFKLKNLRGVKRGVLCEVPIGALKGNSLFSNIGPNIPIRLAFIGQVQANLETKISSYGINNISIETNIVVTIEEMISMPVSSRTSTVVIRAPLSIKLLKGIVPDYYSNIEGRSDTISVPIE